MSKNMSKTCQKHATNARDRQAFVSRWIDSTLQRLNRSTQGPLDATWAWKTTKAWAGLTQLKAWGKNM
jgi:hypothetical protein